MMNTTRGFFFAQHESERKWVGSRFTTCWWTQGVRLPGSSLRTPRLLVAGGRGALRGDEAREWLERRRNEAIAEVTLAVATIAMLAAIVAAVRG